MRAQELRAVRRNRFAAHAFYGQLQREVAGLLGFGGIASAASGVAQILFFIFLVLFVVSLIAGLMRRRV